MAAQCGRQGRGDAQCRCKDRNRLEYRSLGQEVFQQRHYHRRQYGNGGQHPTDALGHAGFLQHGLGILRQTGIIQRHRLFRLLRQLRRPFSQAALRQGAAGHRPQGGHGPAAFPLAGILHQLAPGIKEQDKYRQRQEDIVPILLQQGRLRRHKAALQQAGEDRQGHIGIVALPAGEQRQKAIAQRAAAAQGRNGGQRHHPPQSHGRRGREEIRQQQVIHRCQRQIDNPQQHHQVEDQGDCQASLPFFQRLHQGFSTFTGSRSLPKRLFRPGHGNLPAHRHFLPQFWGRLCLLFFGRGPFLRLHHRFWPLRLLPLKFRFGRWGRCRRGFSLLQQLPRERLCLFYRLGCSLGGCRSFRRCPRRPRQPGLSSIQLPQQVLRSGGGPLFRLSRPFLPGAFFLYFPQDIVYIIAVFCHLFPSAFLFSLPGQYPWRDYAK